MQALSKGLGLEDENALNEAVGWEKKETQIRMNNYPPCPQPDMVLGISPHSDPHILTILLHDETPGLQISKDGSWVKVQSTPGALIVNIAMHFEVPRFSSILTAAYINYYSWKLIIIMY